MKCDIESRIERYDVTRVCWVAFVVIPSLIVLLPVQCFLCLNAFGHGFLGTPHDRQIPSLIVPLVTGLMLLQVFVAEFWQPSEDGNACCWLASVCLVVVLVAATGVGLATGAFDGLGHTITLSVWVNAIVVVSATMAVRYTNHRFLRVFKNIRMETHQSPE